MRAMKLKFASAAGFGALLLAVSSVLSRMLGVLRDYVFAKIFGIGDYGGIFALDAYYLAFRIPDLLYTLLILGALSSAFIPLYARLKKENEVEANRFVNDVLSSVFLLLLTLGGLLLVVAPWVIPVLAPGFDSETQKIAVDLTRILLLSPLFLGLSGILQGVENVHQRFLGMALAPLLYNGSIIAAALLFGNDYGVYALAWGVAAGALLHFLTQVPGVFGTSFRFKLRVPEWTRAIKEFFYLSLPRVLGMSASQITLFVDFALASTFSLGAVSVYSYALNLQAFPYGVVAVSFSVAIFSTLAEQALLKDKGDFTRTLKNSFGTIWFWALPATVGLFLLREPLVELILKGGAFDETAFILTTKTFAILIWSALPLSLIPLWSRAFYSLSNTKTPVKISVLTMLLNVILSVTFTQVYHLSVYGLAAANFIASSFNALSLLVLLRRDLSAMFKTMLPFNLLLSSGIAVVIMTGIVLFLQGFSYGHALWELLLNSVLGGLVYMGMVRILHWPKRQP